MISSSFIAQSDSLNAGCFLPETGRSTRGTILPPRGAMTLAAVDALHRSFSGSDKWPVACAGFSGGGKGVGYIAPLLARNGCRIAGIYMTGANEDHLSDGYARIQPGGSFLIRQFTSAPATMIESQRWSSSTLSPVQSSEPGSIECESGLFVAGTK